MTTPMPASGEPVPSAPAPAAAAPDDPVDRRAVRVLWWKTIAVLAVALIATAIVVAWQWLAPASGTVAR